MTVPRAAQSAAPPKLGEGYPVATKFLTEEGRERLMLELDELKKVNFLISQLAV